MNLLAQFSASVHPTFWRVVLMPLSLAVIGFIIFAAMFEASLAKRRSIPWRHVGTICIAIGLLASIRTLSFLLNSDTGSLYRATIYSTYTLAAHYAMPGILLLILVGIGVGEAYLNRTLPE